jgi:hypothetical protein
VSTAFLSVGYEHINRGGASRLFGVGQSSRYNTIRESQLGQLSFDGIMSSIDVYASPNSVANVLLFANGLSGWWFSLGDFAGDFVNVGAAKGGSTHFENLTDHGFNDRTHSLLVVNTAKGPEFRVSFRDQFLDSWNTTLDAQLGSSASRKGDPLMTWAAFPENVSYLDPGQIYLEISQQLNINIDWWPDYDASITYHLFLYLDGAGKLHGYAQRWSAWVESGVKSGEIMDQLWPKVESGVATLNARLAQRFASLPNFKSFYYLPGRQLAPATGVETGTTWDDVTLVFEI